MGTRNDEFDRSVCFTFYGSYALQGKRIRRLYGDKVAADYYEAIIDYALNQKPIEDENLMVYIGDTILETINSSQKRRSRGFKEDMEVTRSIIEYVRDHPGVSQNEVAAEIHCSKGKVNNVLKKFKEGKYENEFDFNIILQNVEYKPNGQTVTDEEESEYEEYDDDNVVIGTYSTSNINNTSNTNSTDRYRDRFAGATDTGSVDDGLRPDASLRSADGRFAPDVANAPSSADATQANLDRIKYYQSLDYEAMVDNESLPRIVFITYRNMDHELYDDEYARKYLVDTFSGGFYQAKNTENITELIDGVLNREIYFEK